jgi:hypothetical protein
MIIILTLVILIVILLFAVYSLNAKSSKLANDLENLKKINKKIKKETTNKLKKFLEKFKLAEKEFAKLKKDIEKHEKDKEDLIKIIGKKDHSLLIGMSCMCKKKSHPQYNYKKGMCMGTGHKKDYKDLDKFMKKWEKEGKQYSYLPCIDGKFMDSKLYKKYKAKSN